ncbi:MAG: DNA cytosine methyltransferase [Coriobacteriia bacterium]|nr:DNA cytosine methyltransferase [Coriobacteriia bacterium]
MAAEWAGFVNVGSCDTDDYVSRVHAKHWPDVPNFGDIRTLTKETYYEATGLHTATVISGGFPCQPFSSAGKRRGFDDDRYLWPEMFRVIQELRPDWVIGENVARFVKMGLDRSLSDLEAADYEARAFVLPACSVSAPQERQRCFIVANASLKRTRRLSIQRGRSQQADTDTERSSQAVSDAECLGLQAQRRSKRHEKALTMPSSLCEDVCHASGQGLQDGPKRSLRGSFQDPQSQRSNRWAAEPDVGRMAHGVSARVDRLRCLGNAIVPQQIYPIFEAIAEIERIEQ